MSGRRRCDNGVPAPRYLPPVGVAADADPSSSRHEESEKV
jgi:hypothetical protein